MVGFSKGMWWRVGKAMLRAVILSVGEISVGLVPLLAHYIVSKYNHDFARVVAVCDRGMINCTASDDSELAEMDVLAIVISGLGLLSLIDFGPHGHKRRFTPITYAASIAAIGLLVVGSLLYAMASMGGGTDAANVTVEILYLSIAVSFYLSLEEAWLEAIKEPESKTPVA